MVSSDHETVIHICESRIREDSAWVSKASIKRNVSNCESLCSIGPGLGNKSGQDTDHHMMATMSSMGNLVKRDSTTELIICS